MLTRIGYRIHTTLERYFPEKRLYLKSDNDTRFVRLRAHTQIIFLIGFTLFLGWVVVATSIVLVDGLGAGSAQEQTLRQQSLYEERLTALGHDRDRRSDEAARAQERFNLALRQVAEMQLRLLSSEDRRRELETGVDVIQSTLRRTIDERTAVKDALDAAHAELTGGGAHQPAVLAKTAMSIVDSMSAALSDTAQQRDMSKDFSDEVVQKLEAFELEKRAERARNDEIFTKLEEAVEVSIAPLDAMFKNAKLNPEPILKSIRRAYSGQGGPVTPLSVTPDGHGSHPDEARVNSLLEGLDRVALYRLAMLKTPFGEPVSGRYRLTSGFGYRRDPFNGSRRMHSGTDFAGAHGTPIVATGDGVVIEAGRDSGYGNVIRIRHADNIETVYAHLSKMRVKKGDIVSRGDRIGDMGSTGRSSGTHLHYEVRIGKKPVNAMNFIKAARNVF